MKTPKYESTKYAFYVLRVGAALIRKGDNASVYFQPGKCATEAEKNVANSFAHPEIYPGESVHVFNRWAAEYFPLKSKK